MNVCATMDDDSRTTCGMCSVSGDMRHCSVCQRHLCQALTSGPRTVCSDCILTNRHRLSLIFTTGKDSNGHWIDPASRLPVPTCAECGCPELPMRCSKLSGCCHTEEARAQSRAATAELLQYLSGRTQQGNASSYKPPDSIFFFFHKKAEAWNPNQQSSHG